MLPRLPSDDSLEIELLSILLNEPESIEKINRILNQKHFYYKNNKVVFSIIDALYSKGKPIDFESVHYELSKIKDIDPMTLMAISGQYVTSALAKEISDKIIELARHREFITGVQDELTNAYDDNMPISEIIDSTSKKIYDIEKENRLSDFVHIKAPAIEVYSAAIVPRSENDEFIKTGFYDIDYITGGLPIGEMSLLAARPACGKTTLALQIANNIGNNFKVGFVSLEMNTKQLVKRLFSTESGINTWKFGSNGLNDGERSILTESVSKIEKRNIYIDDEPGQKITTICKKARKLNRDKNIKVLIIDYLQYIHSDLKHHNKNDEITYISRSLKELAKELNIAILCLSQLNREAQTGKPVLSHLRDSGSLEQDAAVVYFIWNQENDIKILIAKNRFGNTGTIELKFLKNCCRFVSTSGEYSND